MLGRTPACIECGRIWGDTRFRHEDGAPIYWSDIGLLCSSGCAQAHFDRRRAEGALVAVPADCPVEV